jgi:hypothetical protein
MHNGNLVVPAVGGGVGASVLLGVLRLVHNTLTAPQPPIPHSAIPSLVPASEDCQCDWRPTEGQATFLAKAVGALLSGDGRWDLFVLGILVGLAVGPVIELIYVLRICWSRFVARQLRALLGTPQPRYPLPPLRDPLHA